MNSTVLNKLNTYLINKKEMICIEETADDILAQKVNPNVVFGMVANLDTWGYTLSEECIRKLLTLSESSVVSIYNQLVEVLKEIKGDDVNHDTLLFKNFPDSCRAIDINELSDRRFISYYVNFFDTFMGTNYFNEIEWDGEVLERKEASHDRIRTITLGTEEDFCKMVNNMLGSRMSLSTYDKEIIDFAIANFDSKKFMPEEIPFKENWAYMFKKCMAGEINYDMKFTTFTDFIRATVAMSDGDITLAKKPKLRNFTSSERRELLKKLNEAAKRNPKLFEESLLKKKNRRFFVNIVMKGWHAPTNYAKHCSHFMDAYMNTIDKYSSMSLAEQALSEGKYLVAAQNFEKASPGELIRRANALLDKAPMEEKYAIAGIIAKHADKVAPPVLLNLKNALTIDSPLKVAFIKGSTAKVHMFENKRKVDETTRTILTPILDNAIEKQFKDKESVGAIYIDPALKDCPVPFAGRNDNGKNRSVERGTRLPAVEDKDIIRAFCFKQYQGGGFYDLSASFLDENFALIEQCSWTQLKSSNTGKPIAVHSGDNSRCNGPGCTEFIDIDLKAIQAEAERAKETKEKFGNIRYIAFQVFAWNHVPFSQMQRCFFGIMQRDSLLDDKITPSDIKILQENKVNISGLNNSHDPFYFNLTPEQMKLVKDYKQEVVFDPATVDYRYDLTGDTLCKVPMLYDVQEKKFIFTDLDAMSQSPFLPAQDKRKEESNVPREIINTNPFGPTLMVEDFIGATAQACYAVVNIQKPNLFDLFRQVSKATGAKIVDSMEEAEVICTTDRIDTDKKVITPFDRDEISSYYLTPSPKEDREEIIVEKNIDEI